MKYYYQNKQSSILAFKCTVGNTYVLRSSGCLTSILFSMFFFIAAHAQVRQTKGIVVKVLINGGYHVRLVNDSVVVYGYLPGVARNAFVRIPLYDTVFISVQTGARKNRIVYSKNRQGIVTNL